LFLANVICSEELAQVVSETHRTENNLEIHDMYSAGRISAILNKATGSERTSLETLQNSCAEDSLFQRIQSMPNKQISTQNGIYKMGSGIMWFLTKHVEYKVYIPASARMENIAVRQIILQEAHDAPYSGHVGIAKTIENCSTISLLATNV